MNPNPRLLSVVGPTAVGKTEIAIQIARRWNGEILNIDSRQVYRGLDVGTAKPTVDELSLARHHLINILDPDQWLNVADFQHLAYQTIDCILARGKLPILAGGTGQYMQAIIKGWQIPSVEPDHNLRMELESFSDTYGAAQLMDVLNRITPEVSVSLDPANVRRVARAIEVSKYSAKSKNAAQNAPPREFEVIHLGLTRPREMLYSRADLRVAIMLKTNWIKETMRTIETYPHQDLPSLTSLGYPEIIRYLNGGYSYAEMESAIKKETHRYIRNQYTWYKEKDKRIKWFDLEIETIADIQEYIAKALG